MIESSQTNQTNKEDQTMAKNTYTIINPLTNEVIAQDKSYTKMYYQVMGTLCTEDHLGEHLSIFKNRTENDPGELVYELISVKDSSGRIHLNNSVALERIQKRHAESLRKAEEAKAAREAAKAAKAETTQPQPEVTEEANAEEAPKAAKKPAKKAAKKATKKA